MPDANGNPLPGDTQTGLMNTVPAGGTTPVTTYTPAQAQAKDATATGYDPTAFTVTPDQTVQGQIGKITATDSPIMQQATRRANEYANSRGLMDSSLAAGWGEQSVLDAATPIATADAATYNQAATNTVAAQNTAKAFTAGAQNTASNLNAGLETDVSKTNAGAANTQLNTAAQSATQQTLNTADNATRQLIEAMQNATDISRTQLTNQNQLDIANIDQTTKEYLGNLDANNRQLLQTNANASAMYVQAVKNIADIANDATMTPDAKQAATQSQLNFLNEGLQTTAAVASTNQSAVDSLNLSQYFVGMAA